MNSKRIQSMFGLEQEFENWCVKFDPQDEVHFVFGDVSEVCRMPPFLEFDMRMRLDDRFAPGASLC